MEKEFTLVCNCVICNRVIQVKLDREPKEGHLVGHVCATCYETESYENPALFGDFIFKLRKQYGWSRKYLATKLGFNSESSIMNFETGHTIMKPMHVSRFCNITPNNLTVPILYSMFESNSLVPPCRCPCHQDLNNTIPSMYDDNGVCNFCGHTMAGGQFSNNGHWFEIKGEPET